MCAIVLIFRPPSLMCACARIYAECQTPKSVTPKAIAKSLVDTSNIQQFCTSSVFNKMILWLCRSAVLILDGERVFAKNVRVLCVAYIILSALSRQVNINKKNQYDFMCEMVPMYYILWLVGELGVLFHAHLYCSYAIFPAAQSFHTHKPYLN